MRPKKLVLLAGADELSQSVLAYMLKTNAYRVITAASGQEAIEAFRKNGADIVLADVVMEPMDGIKLTSKLKQMASHVPMILLGDPQQMSGAIYSADALLNKRMVLPAELLDRIKIMSARKRGPRPIQKPVPAQIQVA